MFKKREREPSNNFCVSCGRYTNDKKYGGDQWANFFFSCNKCQKVWCADCMGQLSGLGARKTFKSAKTGNVSCPECNNFIPMIKNPQNLPFIQQKQVAGDAVVVDFKSTEIVEDKICKMCGQRLRSSANFCDYCGTKL